MAESTLLWGVSLAAIYLGMVNIFSSEMPVWLPYMFDRNSADQYDSYSLFIVALCAISLAFVALEGTLWPVAWYSIASLSYTGYLFGLMVVFGYGAFGWP